MGLILLKQGDRTRPNWYAKYKDGNRWLTIDLRVRVRGTPPASRSVTDTGDAAFERSRDRAQAAFEIFVAQFMKYKSDGGSMPTLLKDKELKKTSKLTLQSLAANEEMRLRKLSDAKDGTKEARLLNEKIKFHNRVFSRFATFASNHQTPAHTLRELTTSLVDHYFANLKAHYSRSEVGKHLHLIESAWKRNLPTGLKSPFGDIPELLKKLSKENPAIPRRPLTTQEVSAVWRTAQNLDNSTATALKLHPLALTAACTGMRIGDCCNLKWSSVRLDAKPHPLITVKTAKTGQTVTLPIFDELLSVLADLDTHRDCRDEYVFPAAHNQYTRDVGAIVKRGKRLFARALFADAPEEVAERPARSPQEVIGIIRAVKCDINRTAEWKERVIDICTRHVIKGESYGMISKSLGISKGQISSYIATVEKLTGDRIRNGGNTVGGMTTLMEKTKQAHAKGGRKSSIYGWHSLRATFVVLALSRRIPEEVVAKIVGHATVDMTRRYFNPTEKNAADIFANYMGGSLLARNAPQALVNAPGSLPAPDAANITPATPDAPQAAPAVNLDALKAQFAALPPEQRQSLLAALK